MKVRSSMAEVEGDFEKLGRSSTSRGCGANSRMRRRSASFCIRMRISCTITSLLSPSISSLNHEYASWSSPGKARLARAAGRDTAAANRA